MRPSWEDDDQPPVNENESERPRRVQEAGPAEPPRPAADAPESQTSARIGAEAQPLETDQDKSGGIAPEPDVAGHNRQFAAAKAVRVGILGGKEVGKSYLFQAMVFRILHTAILDRHLKHPPYLWRSLVTSNQPLVPISNGEFHEAYIN